VLRNIRECLRPEFSPFSYRGYLNKPHRQPIIRISKAYSLGTELQSESSCKEAKMLEWPGRWEHQGHVSRELVGTAY